MSPDSRGDCRGPLCRMLFAVGRSSEEPSAARSDRDAVHCVARHAVRRSRPVATSRCLAARKKRCCASILRCWKHGIPSHDTFSRVFRILDPRSFEEVFLALHQGVCDGGQNQGRGSSRWQGTEKSLRTRPKSHAASDGDGVERNDPHGARQCAGAWKQRSGRRFASRRASSAERLRRHGGCAALSSRDGESHRGARWRLRLGGKEQPARFAARCQGRDLRVQSAKKAKQATCTRTPVTAARKPGTGDRGAGQGYGRRARLSGSQGRREDGTSKRGRDKTVERYFLLTQYYTPAELLRVVREHWGIEKRPALDTRRRSRRGSDAKPKRPRSRQLAVLRRLALTYRSRSSRIQRPRCESKLKRAAWDDSFLVDSAPEHAIALPARVGGINFKGTS